MTMCDICDALGYVDCEKCGVLVFDPPAKGPVLCEDCLEEAGR
jgi:hypothetical protein